MQDKNYKLENDCRMLDRYEEKIAIGEKIREILVKEFVCKVDAEDEAEMGIFSNIKKVEEKE